MEIFGAAKSPGVRPVPSPAPQRGQQGSQPTARRQGSPGAEVGNCWLRPSLTGRVWTLKMGSAACAHHSLMRVIPRDFSAGEAVPSSFGAQGRPRVGTAPAMRVRLCSPTCARLRRKQEGLPCCAISGGLVLWPAWGELAVVARSVREREQWRPHPHPQA